MSERLAECDKLDDPSFLRRDTARPRRNWEELEEQLRRKAGDDHDTQ